VKKLKMGDAIPVIVDMEEFAKMRKEDRPFFERIEMLTSINSRAYPFLVKGGPDPDLSWRDRRDAWKADLDIPCAAPGVRRTWRA
jgi:hypothetical protein